MIYVHSPEDEVFDHLPLLEPLSDAEKAHLNAQISRRHFQAGEQPLASFRVGQL